MLTSWHVISCFLFIIFKCCLADNDNLQDVCPAAIPSRCHDTVYINGFPCKNPQNITASDFKTSDLKSAGKIHHLLRSSTKIVGAAEFPGLNTLGLGLARTDLDIDGIVTPHSHPRAAEMLFVSRGTVSVGFIDTRNQVFKKILKEGDVFIVPKGMLHFCMNVGYEFATLFSILNSQNPGLFDITGGLFGSSSEITMKMKERGVPFPQSIVDYHTSDTETFSNQHTEL